ncbi:MAG: tRNA lysidine(34) synthetase TilS [Candidatus Zixiibacteriota bacterium]|nr:MAG: tRNA lysidine(34) synthetase TilS [candidate division Zixibacteria bacterium]
MENLLKQIKKNIAEKQIICSGDKILVSFSGGPDSTALLYSLYKIYGKKAGRVPKRAGVENPGIIACYINHNIRPKAAKNEIKFCRDFCNKLNIPFIIIEADIPRYAKEQKLSIEEAGRNFRKDILHKIAREKNCNKIALGHHLDDTIETILFRLFRGTGPAGLSPIKPISGKFIRPLFNIPKSYIISFLEKDKIKYMLDRSNLESDFSRNYIRNKIIPVIEKHFGLKYKNSIDNFCQILADEDNFLNDITEKITKKLCTITPGGKIVVDLKKIAVYDICIRRRIIKRLLEKKYKHPGAGSFEQIERINDLIEGRRKTVDLGRNLRVVADRGNLMLSGGKIKMGRRNLAIPDTVELPEVRAVIKTQLIAIKSAKRKKQKNSWKINIDADKIVMPLEISGIGQGDRFQPLGLNGTKKVGDYLTDKKSLRQIRDEIPVIKDKKGIIWLVGYEISDRIKINNKTKKVLEIELIRRKDDARYPQI